MASILPLLIIAALLFITGYGVFLKFNMGLAKNSRGQQLRRYALAAVQAILPLAFAGIYGFRLPVIEALSVSLLWIFTYNILYDKTHRPSSPDYDNHMDIAFGIYLFGWLTALHTLLSPVSPVAATIVVGIIEAVLIIIPLAQIAYYATYKVCIDDAGMAPLLNTYFSEAVEFVKSFGIFKSALALVAIGLVFIGSIAANYTPAADGMQWWQILLVAALFIYFSIYIWKPRHGLFVRCGVINLYIDVRNYNRSLRRYRTGMTQRLADLKVSLKDNAADSGSASSSTEKEKPHTIIMVIGESACRDYMSAFTEQPFETTPWESKMKRDEEHFMFFRNAYSCAMQTVPSLERVLTERNQYNNKDFSDSCSIVDIAQKAGYTIRWFSNQSYIGINDTSVTLVANTSDTATWVKKVGGVQQFDTSLISFLDDVDPTKNNLVVLHLKGSHFNYINRYPESYARDNRLHQGDDVECYRNSIHFTDHVLQQFFEKAKQRLNLQAMVYFSDHGGIPDMRRSPRFLGFKMVRIPMWIYLSDEYQKRHTSVADTLKMHRNTYFTNDLVYELMCGIMDVESNRYDETQSLASPEYKYTRDTLLTYDGRIRIKDDDLDV